ncbi:helix-turn-helix domain-containing protein [Natronoarchaeum rubrum]|uniref:helix-turn-helix domain-containing protein n=1 Tax=Natronoarchaeum rubrum TaxID=755311 RepID=UPI002112A4A1|nr:helix-turn-helix domain-containing protein [Natronoarchaeum rubrum]
MSVVVEFGLDSGEFELGRILELTAGEELQLEAVVPTGERAVPSFWTDGVDVEAFEGRVRDHEAVESLTAVQTAGERCLYALEWNRRSDPVIAGIRSEGGQLLQASAEADGWEFQIRFPTRGPLSAYQSRLRDAGIVPSIRRVYTPSDLDGAGGYGLTDSQREALTLAVARGYYDVPRSCSTAALGEALGVSDQAITERLRRGTDALVSATLLPDAED